MMHMLREIAFHLENGSSWESDAKKLVSPNFLEECSQALKLMHEGDKWRLFIPPELAYGDQAQGEKITPNSLLIFEIELVAVK